MLKEFLPKVLNPDYLSTFSQLSHVEQGELPWLPIDREGGPPLQIIIGNAELKVPLKSIQLREYVRKTILCVCVPMCHCSVNYPPVIVVQMYCGRVEMTFRILFLPIK